jgi:DNA-binding response OmpR family regulator
MKTYQLILENALKAIDVQDSTYATDGTTALEMMESETKRGNGFDLVVCDWILLKMDGIELLKIIRAHKDPSIRNVRFIMITGSDEKIREAMESGSDHFISKPIAIEKVRERIEFLFRFLTTEGMAQQNAGKLG